MKSKEDWQIEIFSIISWNYNTKRKSRVMCSTQLAGGLLLKKAKIFLSYVKPF